MCFLLEVVGKPLSLGTVSRYHCSCHHCLLLSEASPGLLTSLSFNSAMSLAEGRAGCSGPVGRGGICHRAFLSGGFSGPIVSGASAGPDRSGIRVECLYTRPCSLHSPGEEKEARGHINSRGFFQEGLLIKAL